MKITDVKPDTVYRGVGAAAGTFFLVNWSGDMTAMVSVGPSWKPRQVRQVKGRRIWISDGELKIEAREQLLPARFLGISYGTQEEFFQQRQAEIAASTVFADEVRRGNEKIERAAQVLRRELGLEHNIYNVRPTRWGAHHSRTIVLSEEAVFALLQRLGLEEKEIPEGE